MGTFQPLMESLHMMCLLFIYVLSLARTMRKSNNFQEFVTKHICGGHAYNASLLTNVFSNVSFGGDYFVYS